MYPAIYASGKVVLEKKLGLGALSALAHLDVRDNNLRTLPQSLWHCHSLQTLNASSNVLSALPIPESTDMPLARSLVCMSIAD